MKRRILAILAACLLICVPAGAEGLARALPTMSLDAFLDSPGFTIDESSGDFSLESLPARALLRAIERGELSAASSGGVAVFYLRIEGNAKTGMYCPVLRVAYAGPRALNATALSLRAGDIRYDFALAPDESAKGVETYAAMLDRDGVAALLEVQSASSATLRLSGDRTYTTKLNEPRTQTAKARLQNHSLACVDLNAELSALGFDAYRFEAENAEAWFLKTGVRPLFQRTDLNAEVPSGEDIPALDKSMGMLTVDGDGESLKLLKEALRERNLLTAAASTSYDLSVKRAVEDLQAESGMVQTGSADAALLRLLFAPETQPAGAPEEVIAPTDVAPDAEVSAKAGEAYAIDGVMELTLRRYWAAGRAMTSRPTGALSYQDVLNTDHALLIADGEIRSRMAGEMSFNRTLSAVFTLNGTYAYPATVKCESDGGGRMDASLLPLGQSRVFIIAEAPLSALEVEGSWTLTVECEGRTLNYLLN